MIKTLKKPIIGYKKAKFYGSYGADCIVKLRIPVGAKVRADNDKNLSFLGETHRRQLTDTGGEVGSQKLRSSKARVLSVTSNGRGPTLKESAVPKSSRGWVVYKAGRVVKPRMPFALTDKACASGIHFFLDRKQAVNYTDF